LTNRTGRATITSNGALRQVRFDCGDPATIGQDLRGIAYLRGAVRTWTRQFVLLFGTLLSFGSGGPLFAGMICIPSFDGPSDDPLQAWLAQSGGVYSAENNDTSAVQLALPSVPEETVRFQDRSLALLGGARDGPAPRENSVSGASDSDGLNGNQVPPPAAPPSAKPPPGGNNGVTGTAPGTAPTDQQFAMATSSVAPARDGAGEASLSYSPPSSEHHALPLFRPPRQG